MPKKVGLPEFIKMKHDHHLVDEISLRTKTPVIRNIPIEKIIANQMQPRTDMGDLSGIDRIDQGKRHHRTGDRQVRKTAISRSSPARGASGPPRKPE